MAKHDQHWRDARWEQFSQKTPNKKYHWIER